MSDHLDERIELSADDRALVNELDAIALRIHGTTTYARLVSCAGVTFSMW